MNEYNKEKAVKHIEEELRIAGINVAYEARCMLNACEKAVIDQVLEIIDRYYLWHLNEKGNYYVTVGEEIKAEILSLKGGEQER